MGYRLNLTLCPFGYDPLIFLWDPGLSHLAVVGHDSGALTTGRSPGISILTHNMEDWTVIGPADPG